MQTPEAVLKVKLSEMDIFLKPCFVPIALPIYSTPFTFLWVLQMLCGTSKLQIKSICTKQ